MCANRKAPSYYCRDYIFRRYTQPIISHLKTLEAKVEERQVDEVRRKGFKEFADEIVNLQEIADARNVSLQILKRALDGTDLKAYRMIGDYLLSQSKVESLRKKLEKEFAGAETLALGEVSRIIESLGVAVGPTEMLPYLGYEIEWNGLDYETSKVKKKMMS